MSARRDTLVATWGRGRKALEEAGLESPVLDSRLLLEAATGAARADILTDPHRLLTQAQIDGFDALIARRLAREPVSRILGRKGFWTLELEVTPSVLSPRPETELVVEAALAALPKEAPVRVLDLGTGSGAILLAILASRPNATGLGVDVSGAALQVAARNAEAAGVSERVSWREGVWGEGLSGRFGAIVSNPPYIPSDEIAGLSPEVADHDPVLALDGGADGLDAFRALTPHVERLLAPRGVLAVEVGAGQGEAVAEILRQGGLRPGGLLRDLSGHGRVLTATLAEGQ